MIEILKPTKEKLEILNEPQRGSWINVISPTDKEIQRFRSLVNISEGIFSSLQDLDEIPAIEKDKNFLFIAPLLGF